MQKSYLIITLFVLFSVIVTGTACVPRLIPKGIDIEPDVFFSPRKTPYVAATEYHFQATKEAGAVQAANNQAQATEAAVQRATYMVNTQNALDVTQTYAVSELNTRITQQAIAMESEELALERVRMVNSVRALAPWLVTGLIIILFSWLLIMLGRKEARRPMVIERDERGYMGLVVTHHGAIYNEAKNPEPLMSGGKKTNIPQLTERSQQALTTLRSQSIDIAHMGLRNSDRRRRGWQPETPASERPVFRIFRRGDLPDVSDEMVKILDAEWKEDSYEDNQN